MKVFKYLTITILSILIIPGIKSVAQQNKALLYMQKTSAEMHAIQEDSWEYSRQAAHGRSARKVETKRKELIGTSKRAMDRVSRMPAFEENTKFRDSVVSFLTINYLVLKEDFEKIINMEDVAEQSYDRMEAYLLAKQMAGDKLEQAGDMVEEQYEIFAAEHNILLTEDKSKLGRKLAKASEVFKHNNEVYLVFFKSYKQEAYYLDALERKDLNSMEQNKNALKSTVAEGLKQLKEMKGYNGDNSLIYAAKGVLDFYYMEATTKLDQYSDYFLNEEKFEQVQKIMNAKSQSSRTRADIEEYNEAVKEMNKRSDSFNKLNQELNILRSKALERWNNQSDRFIDSHVPRRK